MVSCVLVLTTGKSSCVHNDCRKTAQEVEKLVSAGLITLVPVILDALDFDYGPPKHSSSSCLPFSIADQSHVHQGVTYISK